MTAKERTLRFIEGKSVDRLPFHPLVMQYAAQMTGVPFSQYCLDYKKQCEAMIGFAKKFGLDWFHPSGFPYCEAGAYGLAVEYPYDNLPYHTAHLFEDPETEIGKIKPLDIENNPAMMNRVDGVHHYAQTVGDEYFVAGHCEGPLAEYTDLRGVSEGFMDLYDYPDEVKGALRIIVDNAKRWITLQIQAGAVCMSIGDAVCSQISLPMYEEFILPLHKELVKHVHSLGALVKFHICGDITQIIPHLVNIGTNIIDIDSLVSDVPALIKLLGQNQVFCGNIDPVALIKNGTPDSIDVAVKNLVKITANKCMISGGCEIPKDTPDENYRAFFDATKKYKG